MKPLAQVFAFAIALASANSQALVTVTYSAADPGSGAFSFDFDATNTNFAGGSIAGGIIRNADVPGAAVKPAGSIDNYWSLDPGPLSPGSIVFTTALSGLSFLWGSPDGYNHLQVNLVGGGSINIDPFATNGENSNSRYLTLGVAGGPFISGLSFSSEHHSFEVDNLRITAVPEPGTYALLLAGLGAIGFMAKRRRLQR